MPEREAVHPSEPAMVAVVRCDTYALDAVRGAIARGLALLGGIERFAAKGDRILLKPNLLVAKDADRAVTTHPSVFRAVAETFREAGATLSFGDSPGFGRTAAVARRSGLSDVADALEIPLADFTSGVPAPFPDGDLIKQFTIAQGVHDADGIISLPKLKTHGLTRITGAVKNQFGCIPGVLKAEFHARLPNAELFSRMLVDLNRLLKPRLFIMDGIVAMEGNGPQSGTTRAMNVLLFSADPVALDATACRLVGLDPALVPTNSHGERMGLGRARGIEWVGDPLEPLTAPDFDVNRERRSTSAGPDRLSRIARRLVVPRPAVREGRCTRCGTCVSVCPVTPKAIAFPDDEHSRAPIHDYGRCIRCYCCQEMCPEGAIDIVVPPLGRLIHR